MLRSEISRAPARVAGCCALALAPLGLVAISTAASAQSSYMDYRSPRQSYGYDAPPRQDTGYGTYNRPANWHGSYGGVHLGYGLGSVDAGAPYSISAGNDGGIGGVHLGYNWQNGPMVLGLEGDLGGSWASGRNASALSSVEMTAGTAWIATLRGRVGYSFGSMLIYATGGAAMTRTMLTLTDGGWTGKADDVLLGWTLGGGLEYKFSPTISTRIEALHYRFNDKEFGGMSGMVPYSADQTVIRAGITLHLR